ncbi:N-6 DNA methylase [Clostridium sp.]|uniref:N-6 DNA methylase n=1 Tax=Clostridium sp. TaxID=1506 RepID=UPI002915783F|nr:N-6 DNA methylase [Clostridium sp.]MDU4847537.1 N-6 DNA methylase [Clostridium sp.]
MKSLTLAHDIFRGEYLLDNWTKRKLIAAISSIKVILNNKERLIVDIEYDWIYASLNKENLIEVLREIERVTGLLFFDNNEGIEVLKAMKDYDFDKLISIINSVVDSNNVIDYCRELRLTANVDGKMHDNTTPYRVLEVPIRIINPSLNSTIVDYFNGESGTEIVLNEFFGLSNEEGYKLQYYGQEVNKESYAIGELINFLITGNKDRIIFGDSIRNPAFIEGNGLMQFDVAISNPPFMVKVDKDVVKYDNFNRFKYGITENNSLNSDWIIANHILSSIKQNGKGAILLPIGALFRMGAEERSRKYIINEDLIETIIRIPAAVLSYTNIVTCWVIFNKNKEEDRKGKIQFIDLTDFVESIDRRNYTISQEGVDKAVKAYKELQENEISFFLDREKLEEKQYDLNAFDYIKSEKLIESMNNIKMTEFCKVAQIRRGVQVNKGKLDALNIGSERTHYLISIGNIVDGKIVVNESDKIQIERKWEGVYEVKRGDLLITSKGTQFKVAMVEEDIKAIVSANLFIVRVDEDKYIPEILKYYLESELGQSLVEGIIKGTAIKSIAHKDIEKFLVPEIDMDIQKEVVGKLRRSNKEYEERINEAQRIYNQEQEEIKETLNFII